MIEDNPFKISDHYLKKVLKS